MTTKHVSDYAACRVPLRRITFGGLNGAQFVVHEGAVASIKRIERNWVNLGGNDFYVIRKKDSGAYNCRKTTSGSSWSKHSWGCAVDINWQTNPYGSRLVTDMPAEFVQLWKEEGWGWGGNWRSVKDAMHFSKFPNEGGDGLLFTENGASSEEDEVTSDDLQKINTMINSAVKPLTDKVTRLLDVVEETIVVENPDGTIKVGEDGKPVKERVDGIKLLRTELAELRELVEAKE